MDIVLVDQHAYIFAVVCHFDTQEAECEIETD